MNENTLTLNLKKSRSKMLNGLIFHCFNFNPLSANPTKCLNTLKQFFGKKPTNCLCVFDHFAGLALKGLSLR